MTWTNEQIDAELERLSDEANTGESTTVGAAGQIIEWLRGELAEVQASELELGLRLAARCRQIAGIDIDWERVVRAHQTFDGHDIHDGGAIHEVRVLGRWTDQSHRIMAAADAVWPLAALFMGFNVSGQADGDRRSSRPTGRVIPIDGGSENEGTTD